MGADASSITRPERLEIPASGSTQWVSGSIERVPTSFTYQLGLFVTAIALLVIPLLYIALIAAIGYGVYYHATEHVTLLHSPRYIIGRGLLYISPLVAGVLLILVLLKPLFARRGRDVSCFTIERDQAPELFHFIEVIATAVHAPLPGTVELSCEPNASVSIRRGWLGPMGGGLTLTIGMPFLAGMTTRQLAGVLAHEFGHFAQRAGMWSTHIIHSVESWLVRVVFHRDAVDELLSNWGDRFWLIDAIAAFAAICIWTTRKVLDGFLLIAHVIGCFMLRQMEYNADRHQVLLVGSEGFATTARRIAELHMAFQMLASRVHSGHDIGRLGDNLPMMVAHMSRALPKPARDAVHHMLDETSRHPFATHPSMKNRMRAAERVGAEGVFRHDGPAAELVRNFPVVCKWSTIGFYEMVLDRSIDADKLLPYRSVLSQQQLTEGAHATLEEFFCDLLSPAYLIFPDAASMQQLNAKPSSAALESARKRMKELAPQMKPITEKLTEAHQKLQWLELARAVTALGVKKMPNPFRIPLSTESIREHTRQTRADIQTMESSLAPFRSAAVMRIESALACLRDEATAPGLKDRERLLAHMDRVLAALHGLREAKSHVVVLMSKMVASAQFVANSSDVAGNESFAGTMHDLLRDVRRELASLRSLLSSAPLPIRTDDNNRTIGSFLVPLPPAESAPNDTVDAAGRACERYFDLYRELMGRIALMSLKVERCRAPQPKERPQ